MGGLNAFLAWAQLPELFDAAAFQCPAFTSFSPFESRLAKLRTALFLPHAPDGDASLIRRLKDRLAILSLLGTIFRPHFASSEEWLDYQPPRMMKRLAGHHLPPAYIVYNNRDEFGLNGPTDIGAIAEHAIVERNDGGYYQLVGTVGLARFLADHPLNAANTQPQAYRQ